MEQTVAPTSVRNHRKTRIGVVVSNKMQKTITVAYVRQIPHPLYKKYFKKTKTFYVHDEENTAKIGDKVLIMETRPLSRLKRWRLVEVLERAR